jgi:hypothetical protein
VVKPKYDAISVFGKINVNWALVEKGGLEGFIDMDGFEVVKPKYDAISAFGKIKENLAMVEKGGLFGFINKKGIEVVKLGEYTPLNPGPPS